MLKISFAGCLGLSSPPILVQFTLEMCVAAQNHEKFTKTPFVGFKVIQGHQCCNPQKAHQQCFL